MSGSRPEEPVVADVPPLPSQVGSTRARSHKTEGTRTYPCTACGGQLVFGIAEQKLRCPHCGNAQDVEEAADAVLTEGHDLHEAMAALRAQTAEGPQVVDEQEVICQSCGGHTTFTGTLTSTRCPYCATPLQREHVHDAPARLPVDGILPFRVDEKAGRAALEEWVDGRWFAPREFKTYKQTGSFASVYAAYFSYDAHAVTDYTGQRGEDYTVTVGEGEDQRTETRTNWYSVRGRVEDTFDDLCVLANDGLDRDKVTALEPWPTAEVKPFNPEYVAGHLSRTYDHDAEESFAEAEKRMDDVIESSIRSDIGGDRQQISSSDTEYVSLTYRHLLLPIWLLTVIYDGKPFQVCINGVTGEVQGQRPYSKVKIAAAVVAALVVALIAFVLFSG